MNSLDLTSKTVSAIKGSIEVPGDKSISHRSIIFASIAEGTSRISGFLDGEDCIATLNAFRAMGVQIEGPFKQELLVQGAGKYGLKAPKAPIDCGNSGTSIRLLAGLLAGQAFDSQLTGDQSLLQRPMLRVSKPLTEMAARIQTTEGKPPLLIQGQSSLEAIDYLMPEASAQVKSCLLLAGMYAKGQTRITETKVSRDHTERMMKTFSYPLLKSGSTLSIDGKGQCQATDIQVPGDISSAAFFIVAACIIPGAAISIRNVGINPTRTGIITILQRMGANIQITNQRCYGEEPVADIHVTHAPLRGITIDPELVPLAIDEFPAIFIAASLAKGRTELHGARELRVKESDRIAAMVDGLSQLGIDAQALDDGIIIQGGSLSGGEVDSRGDHRIAMSFLIAGAVSTTAVVVLNCANIATSFPTFVTTAKTLGFNIE